MELETMFVEQKWNILQCLTRERLSPLQLSEKLNTTMANISQQLRLLEAVNLVKKEKIKNRDKGKPRSLFSLTDDYVYLISTVHGFANKRLVRVTSHHEIILRIWLSANPELHYSLWKAYWEIEPYMDKITAIAINDKSKDLLLVSEQEKDIEKLVRNKTLNVRIFSKKDAEKAMKQGKEPFFPINGLSIIYDPNYLFKSNGGDKISPKNVGDS